jgi:hypothetical protein
MRIQRGAKYRMSDGLTHKVTSVYVKTSALCRLKSRALRNGVWFRVIRRIDRALLNACINVAQSITNPSLVASILAVTRKIEESLETRAARYIREVGFSLASKLGALAQSLGNKDAWALIGVSLSI